MFTRMGVLAIEREFTPRWYPDVLRDVRIVIIVPAS